MWSAQRRKIFLLKKKNLDLYIRGVGGKYSEKETSVGQNDEWDSILWHMCFE